MERSESYAALERMIHSDEIPLSDLERLLDVLHRQKHITALEQESLLELAWGVRVRTHPLF